jgi:large subunit ribosomal protein L11
VISYYQDKSFTMDIKTPPASYFLKKAAKVNSGAKTPSRETVGTISAKQLREIAEAKMVDLSANDVEAAMKIIMGSAKSMGIEVK